jgi:membrane fusion protein (multidrug efflux system)
MRKSRAAKVNVWRATQDYERYANLIKDLSVTEQQFEQASAAKQTAEKQLPFYRNKKTRLPQQTQAVAQQK